MGVGRAHHRPRKRHRGESAASSGTPVRIEYQADSGEAAASGPEVDETRAPEKHELGESATGGIDPTDLVVDMLDGEVVD